MEIRQIANTLGANRFNSIFLGLDANEERVKTMRLDDRRVIVFATHGLIPGDLDGLSQPALAFSNPIGSGTNGDGLLTMGEIFGLQLDADWVVLSACNTASASYKGAEAISGLGRSFFYAGARTLLVTHWAVETTSAMKLTTGLFRYQTENKELSRAQALQKSQIDLIEGRGLIHEGTGKVAASYAHPFFWAPFIVVGEGGAALN